MLADAFYIRRLKTRRIVFAAGRALQAIDLFKGFFVQVRQSFQYFVFVSLCQKVFEEFLLVFAALLPVMKFVVRHR